MYFTQEDFKKIEGWLKQNAVKDSEFSLASSLTGKEFFALLQDDVNRKISLETFAEFFSSYLDSYAREDFFNVSKYLYNTTGDIDSTITTLENAISVCPGEIQRAGQVITFISPMGSWEIWRYLGKDSSEWKNTSEYWQCTDGKEDLGINVTVSTDTISIGSNEEVTITFKTKDGAHVSKVTLYINGTLQNTYTEVSDFTEVISVSADTEVKVVAYQYGIEYTSIKNIDVVYPCYIGAGEEIITNPQLDVSMTAKSGILSGEYTVTTTATKPYIYLVVPDSVLIQNYAMDGVDIPYDLSSIAYNGFTYNIYKSNVAFDAGTYTITLGSYTGDNKEIIKNLLYRVNTLEEKLKDNTDE